MRTSPKIKMHSPYFFLAKGIATDTFDLFIIIPIWKGQTIKATPTVKYNNAIKGTSLLYEFNSASPGVVDFFIDRQVLAPSGKFSDPIFRETDESFLIGVGVYSGGDLDSSFFHYTDRDVKTYLSYVTIQQNGKNIMMAANAPYSYLGFLSDTSHLIPYIIVLAVEQQLKPMGQSTISVPSTRMPQFGALIKMVSSSFSSPRFLYDTLDINNLAYSDNSPDFSGYLTVEVEDPDNAFSGIDGNQGPNNGGKKKVKVRNQNADLQPLDWIW